MLRQLLKSILFLRHLAQMPLWSVPGRGFPCPGASASSVRAPLGWGKETHPAKEINFHFLDSTTSAEGGKKNDFASQQGLCSTGEPITPAVSWAGSQQEQMPQGWGQAEQGRTYKYQVLAGAGQLLWVFIAQKALCHWRRALGQRDLGSVPRSSFLGP